MKNRRWLIGISLFIVAGVSAWYFFLRPGSFISSPVDAMPVNSIVVIEFNSIDKLSSEYFLALQWQDLKELQLISKLEENILLLQALATQNAKINSINSGRISAAAVAIKSGEVEYLFAIEMPGVRLSKLNLTYNKQTAKVSRYSSNKEDIYEFTFPEFTIVCARIGNTLLFSRSKVLIEVSVSQLKGGSGLTSNDAFQNVYNLCAKNDETDFYLNLEQLSFYIGNFLNPEFSGRMEQLKKFTDWIGFELKFSESEVLINGYASGNASSQNNILSQYVGTEVSFEAIDNFLLKNTAYAIQGNFVDVDVSTSKRNAGFISDWAPWLSNSFTYAVSQSFDAAVINKSYLIVEVTDNEAALQKLEVLSENEMISYLQYNIYGISGRNVIYDLTGFGDLAEPIYVAVIQGYLIAAYSINQLMNVIDGYENQQTLMQDADYKNLETLVASACNYNVYINLSNTAQIIENVTQSDSFQTSVAMQKFGSMIFRFSAFKNMHILSAALNYSKEVKVKSGFAWKTQIDFSIFQGPFLVQNHLDGKDNILVQDSVGQLYLISANGNVVWKRQLEGSITGRVYSVDFYENNKKQILFASTNGIYLIDMLGKDVEGFPITLTAEVTSPLSVLDYDGSGEYRMFLGCNNGNVYGFYKDGKPLPGWNPMKKAGIIDNVFSYIQKDQKDYIAFSNQSGVLSLKNRKGENRVKEVHNDIRLITAMQPDNAKSPSAFLSIDERFRLVKLKLDGVASTEIISEEITDALLEDIDNDGETEVIYLTSDAIIAQKLNGNKLFESQFGSSIGYKLQVFQSGKNVYYGAYNILTQKMILFQSNGRMYEGFPAEAASPYIVLESGKLVVSAIQNFVVAYNIK